MLARTAAFVCIVGVTLAFAWPALASSQAEPEEPAELRGVFTVTIGALDTPRDLPGGPALIGLWTITFNADGTYTVARQDVGVVASGTFEVEGETVTFNDWTGLIGCGTPEAVDPAATYAWRVDGARLTLTAISDECDDRRILLTTRSFGGFEACATSPLLFATESVQPAGTPQASPVATPIAATPSVAVQEGLPQGATPQEAIDGLLRQATGCWATGDPNRFLPLHSQAVLTELSLLGPLSDFLRELQVFMATPVAFERIGDVTVVDPAHAWAYIEIGFGGETIPQRFDFVLENGVWLFDTFFLFGPPPPTPEP